MHNSHPSLHNYKSVRHIKPSNPPELYRKDVINSCAKIAKSYDYADRGAYCKRMENMHRLSYNEMQALLDQANLPHTPYYVPKDPNPTKPNNYTQARYTGIPKPRKKTYRKTQYTSKPFEDSKTYRDTHYGVTNTSQSSTRPTYPTLLDIQRLRKTSDSKPLEFTKSQPHHTSINEKKSQKTSLFTVICNILSMLHPKKIINKLASLFNTTTPTTPKKAKAPDLHKPSNLSLNHLNEETPQAKKNQLTRTHSDNDLLDLTQIYPHILENIPSINSKESTRNTDKPHPKQIIDKTEAPDTGIFCNLPFSFW